MKVSRKLRLTYRSVRLFPLVSLTLAGFLAGTGPAWAGFQLFDPLDTSTGINSNSQFFQGIYEANSNNTQPIPFTIQIYSAGNECVRLLVFRQATDLEMVLVSPDGTVWRDDNSGGSNRALIKANTVLEGWYTVHISRFDGAVDAGIFILRYGRYNSGNPNCGGAPTLML